MKRNNLFVMIILSLLLCTTIVIAEDRDTPYTQEVLMNQDPDPAKPGEYVELRWKVTKYGEDTLKNLQYKIEPEYPFFLDPGRDPVEEIGNWKGYSGEENYYILHYKLRVDKDAVEENYEITLKKRHGNNDWSSKDYEIRVDEAKEPNLVIGKLTSSPQELKSDLDEAELNVQISNIGDEAVENLKTELKLPNGFSPSYSYADSVVLGTIPGGQAQTSQFFIDINKNVDSGLYPATLVARYKKADDDDNKYHRENLPINITLKPKPTFEITDQSIQPESLTPGTTATISLKVQNTGQKEADSVSVHAFKDSSQPFELTEKSDYIGKLEEGEKGEAVVTVKVEDDAERKTHLLDIEIRAIDDEEVIVEEKQVELTVNGGQGKQASPVTGISIIAGIVLVGIVAFYFFRKRG